MNGPLMMMTRSITATTHPALSHVPACLLDLASIRRLETAWLEETVPGELMAAAGAAVARVALSMWRDLPAQAPVILLVGPGNNGGDALVAGRILRAAGLKVLAAGMPALLMHPPIAEDARAAWEAWHADGQIIHDIDSVAQWLWPQGAPRPEDEPLPLAEHLPPAAAEPSPWGARAVELPDPAAVRPALIVDGLFGIGLKGPLSGEVERLAGLVNRAGLPVLAIDVPSGLDADRGSPIGAQDAAVITARQTVTMIADKPGLHTGAGLRHAGRVWVAPLSSLPLEDEWDRLVDESTDSAPGVLLTAPLVAVLLPRREHDAHKGQGGDVLVIGGRLGMAGAARLAAQGAAGAGAGRVWLVVQADDPLIQETGTSPVSGLAADGSGQAPVDPRHPEIMRHSWPAMSDGHGASGETGEDCSTLPGVQPVLVIGCGLGRDGTAQQWLARALNSQAPLVIDADALGLLDEVPEASQAPCCVLTPHPLEAARLLDLPVNEVLADRIGCARRLATQHEAVVVLKGAGTVVAAPDGRYAINTSGHPVLATAGTGDVLAGTIAALLAGLLRLGCPPDEAAWQAACAGTWLHGRAGECLAEHWGPRGVPASALVAQYPAIIRMLLRCARATC